MWLTSGASPPPVALAAPPEPELASDAVEAEPAPGFEPAEVEEGSAGDRAEIDDNPEAARAATGVVRDPDGDVVEGAIVSCAADDGEVMLGDTSDAEGGFALAASAVGCMAVARHRAFGDSAPTRIALGDRNVIHLGRGSSIAGYVVDARGVAVPRYRLQVARFRPAEGAGVLARGGQVARVDDPAGRFELEGLKPGEYVLAVAADGWPAAESDPIALAAGEAARSIRIVLDDGARLSGRVVDGDGAPLPGAVVALDAVAARTRAGRVQTDDDGRYQLDGVPKGPFSIRVSADGFVGKVVAGIETLGADSVERDIELSPSSGGRQTEYTGIGAALGERPTGVVVMSVVPGGPAEAAGLKMQDLIVRVDGRDASAFTIPQAIQLLRGPVGTRVSLTVRRGESEEQITITRARFLQ
jgi:hypothetical protein